MNGGAAIRIKLSGPQFQHLSLCLFAKLLACMPLEVVLLTLREESEIIHLGKMEYSGY